MGSKLRIYCPKCGKTPTADMSNPQWVQVPARCPKCKVQCKINYLTDKEFEEVLSNLNK